MSVIVAGIPFPIPKNNRLEYVGPADPRMFKYREKIMVMFNGEFVNEMGRYVDSVVSTYITLYMYVLLSRL